MIKNQFMFDENGMIYILTGPNHGGKSVFAHGIGITQALFQMGLCVPATKAELSCVDEIFIHFPKGDETLGKGRLGEECQRMSHIFDHITENSLIIADETFSSTSGEEGCFIANQVLTGLGVYGCRGIFVTHIHELAKQVEEMNSHPFNQSKIDNLTALLDKNKNEKRTYIIERTKPDGLSYAKDIAKQNGLLLEDILKHKNT